MLAACASHEPVEIEPDFASDKADGLATHLALEEDHSVDVAEPSDLVVRNHKLYTVSDRHSRIYQIDDDGDVRSSLDVEGTDLEALTVDADGHFYVADESRAKVWRLTAHGDRAEAFDVDTTDGNSGIEGPAFDDKGNLLVAKEKNPATIIVLDGDGVEQDRVELDFADDISALAWNAADDHPYALSAEESKLWRFNRDLEKITSWRLPIEAPEGLAFDGRNVYVVSDPEERIYRFVLGRP